MHNDHDLPTLYHMPVAICAQKNRVCLVEKGVAWASEDVTGRLRSPEYLELNPAGYVPTFVYNGRIVTESRIISEFIDEAFAGPSLQPEDPYLRSIMRRWTKQIDDSLHSNIFLLSFVPFFRDRLMQLSEQDLQKALPLDPFKRERAINMMRLGWDSPYILSALRRFQKLVVDLEAALGESDWLAGDAYSLADADFTPYMQRLQDLGVDWLWFDKPAVKDWYERLRSRPSFSSVAQDWLSREQQDAAAAMASQIGPRFRSILNSASAPD